MKVVIIEGNGVRQELALDGRVDFEALQEAVAEQGLTARLSARDFRDVRPIVSPKLEVQLPELLPRVNPSDAKPNRAQRRKLKRGKKRTR